MLERDTSRPSRNIYVYETHNRPPSEYETRHLSRRISEALAELRTIDDDIVRATHALEALRHRKALRLKDLVVLRKAMAPVRRLPAEILGEIFSWAVTSQNSTITTYSRSTGHRESSLNAKNSPILLTHICARWRAVAHATPKLWTKIIFTLHQTPTRSTTTLIRLFAQKSRAHLLSLQITISSPVEVNNALSFLWQICDKGSFVALSELHFSEVYQFNDSPPSFADVINASEVAPNLRCLRLESHSIPTSLDPLINTIHWNQLTTLTLITPVEFYVAQWILSQCIEMQNFTVDFADAAGATIHLAPQMLPHVQRMCCDAFIPDEGNSLSELDFFRPFSLPSLNIIDLRHLWPRTHIASLHQRSPFRLTAIFARDLCLSQMCQCTTDELYSAITFNPNSTADPLIPLLRKLTTVGSCHEDGDGRTYAAMIESRWWAYDRNCALRTRRISRLESVSIDVAFIDTSQMEERLSNLVSAGVVKFG
ncbi:hypothetical protein C8J57DRAFT_1649977 [Mycena rebaudengoi]|nr:hypothetical protein C8J57DRAFT_1649977 [Mycena rebaudengoi]